MARWEAFALDLDQLERELDADRERARELRPLELEYWQSSGHDLEGALEAGLSELRHELRISADGAEREISPLALDSLGAVCHADCEFEFVWEADQGPELSLRARRRTDSPLLSCLSDRPLFGLLAPASHGGIGWLACEEIFELFGEEEASDLPPRLRLALERALSDGHDLVLLRHPEAASGDLI